MVTKTKVGIIAIVAAMIVIALVLTFPISVTNNPVKSNFKEIILSQNSPQKLSTNQFLTGEIAAVCNGISRIDKDTDNDGVPDRCDNCPDYFNPLQEDNNHNGLGDDCDFAKKNVECTDTNTCTNQCTDGERRCSGTSGVQICRDYNTDGCTEWSQVGTCDSGKTCQFGICL